MVVSTKNELGDTSVYKSTIYQKPISKLTKVQNCKAAVNNLGHRMITNVTDLAIFNHKKHFNNIQLFYKTKQSEALKNELD